MWFVFSAFATFAFRVLVGFYVLWSFAKAMGDFVIMVIAFGAMPKPFACHGIQVPSFRLEIRWRNHVCKQKRDKGQKRANKYGDPAGFGRSSHTAG